MKKAMDHNVRDCSSKYMPTRSYFVLILFPREAYERDYNSKRLNTCVKFLREIIEMAFTEYLEISKNSKFKNR